MVTGNTKEYRVKGTYTIFLMVAIIFASTACQMSPRWEPFEGKLTGVYPGEKWQKVKSPESLGWSTEKLAEARKFAEKIDTAAVMIVDNGVVVDAWGNIDRNYQCHSMRKSLLSALIGLYVEAGKIDMSETMDYLGIDDFIPSLTKEEQQATVGDLIKARSGIYHAALGESAGMKAARPKRQSHAPGTFWYYNNWDFNALGTIFEQETNTKIFEEFDRRFAQPLQMEDFLVSRCRYLTWENYGEDKTSMHKYYLFRVSARDLARFGLLYLREGRWGDRQIVSRKWIRESTASHSRTGANSGYGYMWWTGVADGLYPNVKVRGPSYSASGWGGQRVIVLPYRNLVVVHRVNTDQKGKMVSSSQIGRLLWHILDAAGETEIGDKPTLDAAKGIRLSGELLKDTLSGSTIRGDRFIMKFSSTDTFEYWMNGKLLDTINWWVDGDRCWIKGKVLTGGWKTYLRLVRDGDIIKWYDRQSTLDGKGLFSKN